MTIHALEEEYRAARTAAVLVDLRHRGRVRVRGRDRSDLVHRLSTNDMRGLAPGRGIENLFLTNKGRIFSGFDALSGDEELLLFLSGPDGGAVVEWIMRFVFTEDVTAVDATAELFEFGIYGPAARTALAAGGADPGPLAARDHAPAPALADATVGAATPLAGAGYRIFGPAAASERIWWHLLEQGASTGLRAAGPETAEVLRIEAGIPAAGRELTEQWNPLEAELRRAISFTKGCYTGQEVVARLTTYQKIQRALRGLRIAGETIPPLGSRLLAGGAEVGLVTSAAFSPALVAPIGLGYVALEQSAPGTQLAVELEPGGDAAPATVLVPPFI